MMILYTLLFTACLLAIAWLAIPYYKHHALASKGYIVSALFLICFTLGIYSLSGNKIELAFWLKQGKERYHLLSQFNELGGIDGAIQQIQDKLTKNPNDPRGWHILGKLYESKGNTAEAKKAFLKADQLDKPEK